jgi:hypothetical protein
MAILLQFDYNKKLGLPGFSSHSFGISMKAEVADVETIGEEAAKAYSILQQSVDSQIANPGLIPSGNGKAIQIQSNGDKEKTNPDDWSCTIRQRGLILSILERNDLDPEVVEDLAQELHGRPMSDLGKMQVSAVIGEVLDRWGRHPKTNGRNAGGRS